MGRPATMIPMVPAMTGIATRCIWLITAIPPAPTISIVYAVSEEMEPKLDWVSRTTANRSSPPLMLNIGAREWDLLYMIHPVPSRSDA